MSSRHCLQFLKQPLKNLIPDKKIMINGCINDCVKILCESYKGYYAIVTSRWMEDSVL